MQVAGIENYETIQKVDGKDFTNLLKASCPRLLFFNKGTF